MRVELWEWAISWFQHIISTTPLATGLVVLILLLRKAPVLRYSNRIAYALWLVLLVRLWMPWTPPGPIQLWQALRGSRSSVLPSDSFALGKTAELRSFSYPIQQWAETRLPFSGWDIAGAVWIFGMVGLFLVYGGISIHVMYTTRRADCRQAHELQLLLKACLDELRLHKEVQVAVSSQVTSPVLSGWIRPRILVPHSLIQHLRTEEWRSIFLHELIHVRRGDMIWNHAMVMVVIVNWFNPFVWIAYRKMREDQELSCDQQALAYADQQQYAATLLQVAAWKQMKGYADSLLPSFKGSSSRTLIRRRIELIKKTEGNKKVWTPALVGMVIVVAMMTFTGESVLSQKLNDEQQTAAPDQQYETSEQVMALIIPADGRVTNEYRADRPYVSIANVEGTPVHAAGDGIVEQAEYVRGEGNYIRIAHQDGYVTTYSHLESFQVQAGEYVPEGSLIGTMGSTGNSTGPHLKWMLLYEGRAMDPQGI